MDMLCFEPVFVHLINVLYYNNIQTLIQVCTTTRDRFRLLKNNHQIWKKKAGFSSQRNDVDWLVIYWLCNKDYKTVSRYILKTYNTKYMSILAMRNTISFKSEIQYTKDGIVIKDVAKMFFQCGTENEIKILVKIYGRTYKPNEETILIAAVADNLALVKYGICFYNRIFSNNWLLRIAMLKGSIRVVKWLLDTTILNPCVRCGKLRNSTIFKVFKYGSDEMIKLLMCYDNVINMVKDTRGLRTLLEKRFGS